MPPGFVSQCPYGLELPIPITPWIMAEWIIVYALCAETLLLGLSLLVQRGRRSIPRSASVSLLLVTACAVGATAVALWITDRNIQSCFAIPFSPHATPAIHAQAVRFYAELLAQARIAIGVNAAMVVLATALTIVTLIHGWRARSRKRAAAPA